MAIRVKSRAGESVEGLMRRFKKLCEKEGLTKDIKRKEFYEKPSERRRRAMRKSQVRRIKTEMGPVGRPAKPEKRERD
jgi:small subunit ribosomal protein S21